MGGVGRGSGSVWAGLGRLRWFGLGQNRRGLAATDELGLAGLAGGRLPGAGVAKVDTPQNNMMLKPVEDIKGLSRAIVKDELKE